MWPSFFLFLAVLPAPTFTRDVLPILQQHCQTCHRPGEIGPMPLLTYQQTRPWAQAIREAVATRTMPPWLADPRFGHFANDPSLTPAQIDTLRAWAATGAPAGNPADAPPPRTWPTGWNIPRPDAILATPQPFPVPARGTVEYQYVVVPTGFTEDKWVQAAEARPTNRGVVHHLVVYVREPGSSWLRNAPRGVPYVPPAGEKRTTSDILLVYTPGNGPFTSLPGMAKKVPAGADLVFQFHYTPNGYAVQDLTHVGLVFAPTPPLQRVLTLQMGQDHIAIPPGERDYRLSAQGTLPHDALLLRFFPHMHLRGRSFEYALIGPNGFYEVLLRVPRYDFHWQLSYELAEPRRLPQGARLQVTASYDNSVNNPHNPDPTAEVHYGEQSTEEMMIGFFDVAVPAAWDKSAFFVR